MASVLTDSQGQVGARAIAPAPPPQDFSGVRAITRTPSLNLMFYGETIKHKVYLSAFGGGAVAPGIYYHNSIPSQIERKK